MECEKASGLDDHLDLKKFGDDLVSVDVVHYILQTIPLLWSGLPTRTLLPLNSAPKGASRALPVKNQLSTVVYFSVTWRSTAYFPLFQP